MTQINPRINIYQAKPSFKADGAALPFMPGMDYTNPSAQQTIPAGLQEESQVPVVELPDIYYSPNTKKNGGFLDTIRKVDVMELIVPWFEHPLLMLGTCFGISKGVDAFSKSCNQEYEKSILGKAARFGDKIENSKFVQSKSAQTGLGWLRNGWTWVKNTAMKSNIIRSMVETPTMPENAMPKSELLSHQDRTIEKFGEVLRDTGLLPNGKKGGGGSRLVDFHIDAGTAQDLKTFFGVDSISKIPEEKAISRYLLKKAGVAESDITSIVNGAKPLEAARAKLVDMVGGADKLQSLLKGKTEAEINEILNICDKFKGIKTRKGTKIPFLTKQPLTNEAGFQDVYNRLYSIGKGASTKTGRFMSKFLQMVHRGFTFGGAKTGVLIWVAPHIMHTLINTYKAEKDEKVGTFVNGMISAISWVFVFPLVLKGIHAYGGIQYAGMGKENVEKFKEEIAKFNKRVANGEFKSFKEWKAARNKLKKEVLNPLKEVKNQGFITKCLRKISEFTKSDLLKLERYKDKSFIKNILRNGPASAKNFIWSAGRFMVFMLVGMPLVDKLIEKCLGKVFGRKYDDTIEKENKEAKKKQKEFLHEDLQNRMYEAQAAKMGIVANAPEAAAQAEHLNEQLTEQQEVKPETGLVQKQPEVDNNPAQTMVQHQPVQNKNRIDNYTYIPSQENILKTPTQKQMGKYIPSQLPGNVAKTFDNSGLEAALKRADKAEARALQTLAGKFPS